MITRSRLLGPAEQLVGWSPPPPRPPYFPQVPLAVVKNVYILPGVPEIFKKLINANVQHFQGPTLHRRLVSGSNGIYLTHRRFGPRSWRETLRRVSLPSRGPIPTYLSAAPFVYLLNRSLCTNLRPTMCKSASRATTKQPCRMPRMTSRRRWREFPLPQTLHLVICNIPLPSTHLLVVREEKEDT
jgi:hypothetical protein